MISKSAFRKLKRGDVVLFNGRPRTVQEGPGDKAYFGGDFIVFPILRRSWTGRATTTYNYHAVKDMIKLPPVKLSFTKICNLEKESLTRRGWNWHNEMWKEIKEAEEWYERSGLKIPRSLKMARRYIEKIDGLQ